MQLNTHMNPTLANFSHLMRVYDVSKSTQDSYSYNTSVEIYMYFDAVHPELLEGYPELNQYFKPHKQIWEGMEDYSKLDLRTKFYLLATHVLSYDPGLNLVSEFKLLYVAKSFQNVHKCCLQLTNVENGEWFSKQLREWANELYYGLLCGVEFCHAYPETDALFQNWIDIDEGQKAYLLLGEEDALELVQDILQATERYLVCGGTIGPPNMFIGEGRALGVGLDPKGCV